VCGRSTRSLGSNQNVILRTIAIAATLISLTVASAERTLSDRDLIEYASRSYDKRALMHQRIVVGINHGVRVVAEFPCSDMCPDFTVRVIRYDVPPGLDCSKIGGVTKTVRVPEGAWGQKETFCYPRILAEHWNRYKK
jgi:hypothetical protein